MTLKLVHLLSRCLVLCSSVLLAQLPLAAEPQAATASLAASPATLPGKGLAQHPFLYCGEWNYTHPQQTMYLVEHGAVVWSYDIPLDVIVAGKPNKEEFSDCVRLSNGNILFSRRFGATEVTPAKKIVWNYDAPGESEVHSVQALGMDRVLLLQNGNPAKLLIINIRTNTTEKEIVLQVAKPDSFHGQFRRARMTPAGTFLVAHMDRNMVVEYDGAGKEIWSVDAGQAWAAIRLKNGNTLISSDGHGSVREVNPQGDTVWELTRADLPEYTIGNIQDVERLANGNTVISNWVAGPIKPENWPKTAQIIEVTPAKNVVWALRQWSAPNLGPSTSIQLLDEPGLAEEGALQR